MMYRLRRHYHCHPSLLVSHRCGSVTRLEDAVRHSPRDAMKAETAVSASSSDVARVCLCRVLRARPDGTLHAHPVHVRLCASVINDTIVMALLFFFCFFFFFSYALVIVAQNSHRWLVRYVTRFELTSHAHVYARAHSTYACTHTHAHTHACRTHARTSLTSDEINIKYFWCKIPTVCVHGVSKWQQQYACFTVVIVSKGQQ